MPAASRNAEAAPAAASTRPGTGFSTATTLPATTTAALIAWAAANLGLTSSGCNSASRPPSRTSP